MDELRVERRDRVVYVTIDRPERKNALSVPMWRTLAGILSAFDASDDERVLVLGGAGGVFCAGGDISGMGDATGSEGSRSGDAGDVMRETVTAVCLGLHRASKPVIAAVDGLAAGAGANLAFGCDLVLASERARFSEIFVRRGLPIDSGGTWLLPRLVGLQKAKELAFFGDWVEADDALRLGLVNRVVPSDRLGDEVDSWAKRLADGPPAALAAIKRGLNRAFEVSFADALDDEARALAACSATPEARAAIAAFFARAKETR